MVYASDPLGILKFFACVHSVVVVVLSTLGFKRQWSQYYVMCGVRVTLGRQVCPSTMANTFCISRIDIRKIQAFDDRQVIDVETE